LRGFFSPPPPSSLSSMPLFHFLQNSVVNTKPTRSIEAP
jgi:hypothetical protein